MQSSQTSGRRIRLARSILGLTRKHLEEQFEISANTLQSWEVGKVALTPRGAKRLNGVFTRLGLMCSEDWLLNGQGQAPILLQDISTLPKVFTEDICILREMEVFKALNPDPIVSLVSDTGMEPLYEIGDYVAGNKKANDLIARLIGHNCIIETFHGDTFIRKIMRGNKESHYHLACINIHTDQQPLIPDIKIRYAAKIVFHRKKESLANE